MPSQKLKKKIKVPKTKRYKRIRTLALINILLLVFNIFSYFWVSGPGVFKTKAAEVGLCLKICPAGQDNCGNLSAAACQNLISPPGQEEEEEEQQATTQETTVVPSQGPSIDPFTTPLGLVSPQELQRVLIPGEANLPVSNSIKVITAPDQPPISVIDGQTPVIPSAVVPLLTFQGKTNIKDAIIIITLTSPQTFYATTQADTEGNWRWTVLQVLQPGRHYLTILAMSPSDARVRQVHELEFYVEAPEVISPQAPAEVISPRFPEILPPEKLPPIEITKDIYVLKLEAVPVEKDIYPGSQLNLVADIASFEPTVEKEVNLEFTITNQRGEIVFADADILKLKDSVSVIKRLGLKNDIKPGNYIATVQLTKKGITYLTSVGFRIQEKIEKPLLGFPGGIIVSQQEAQKGLFTAFVFLSLLMLFFIILLWREYQKSKREIQISDKDLWQSGQII